MGFDTDILVSGGGIAGLTAAAAFGKAGFRVICVDPTPPVTDAGTQNADHRTTAFLQPARAFLERAGLWDALAPHAAELQIMRIMDSDDQGQPLVTRDFCAADISDQPFGWNLPNWLLSRECTAHLQAIETVQFLPGVSATSLFTRSGEARVTLSSGQRIKAKLVIAADGRNSAMRKAAGIGVERTALGQKALSFAVTHPIPHQNVSTEIHRGGGPFTLVPLPDADGRPCSAVVWIEKTKRAEALAALPKDAFIEEINRRSCLLLGPLTPVSDPRLYPMILQRAEQLSGERLALVAEAAHVVPPIGAQGLNMSLADIETLLDLAIAAPDDVGNAAMLESYASKRTQDIKIRMAGISLLNQMSMQDKGLLRTMRSKGIEALYGMAPIRRSLMQMGLGTRAQST